MVRSKKRIPFYRGSPDHFSLRMLNKGHSVNSINKKVIFICFIHSILITSMGVLFKSVPALIICASLSLVGSVLAYVYFASLPTKETILQK